MKLKCPIKQVTGGLTGLVVFLFYHVGEVRAKEFDIGDAIKLKDSAGINTEYSDVASLTNRILPNIYIVAGVLLLLGFMVVGHKYINSAGEPEKIKETGRHFSYLIVATLIIFVSYWLVQIMGLFGGIDLI